MADKTPLLSDELTEAQKVLLLGLKQHPGYLVFELMLGAACKRATEDVIKLDPIEEGYERKLKALQSKARERNEFSLLVLKSIDWHSQGVAIEKREQKEEPEQNRIVKGLK